MILIQINGMTQLGSLTANIRDLNPKIFRLIYEDLDLGSRWRELIEHADGTRYQLSLNDVEKCAKVIHRSLSASPSEALLSKWGMMGMTVQELIHLMDKLHMERVLIYIRPPERLAITTQPVSELVVEEGGMISLTCEATGFPYPIYVWFHGDNKLSLKQDGQLVIEQATLSHSGKYICRVHHKFNSETPYLFSTWCCILVKPRPRTFNMPEPNNCAVFSGHKPTYNLPVSNQFCGITKPLNVNASNVPDESSFAQVKEPPTIVLQPTSHSDSIGGHTLFVVKASHPYETLFYQWYHNSSPIEGAVTNELRLEIHGIEDAGDYQARVYTRSHGGVLSKVATLAVSQIPNVYTAGDKVALIIGISTYRSFGQPLPAVEHDLYSTIRVFTEMKFKVISLLDLTLTEMVNAVDGFCAMLSSEVYAVFYCAGHGFIFNNQHYLIPWDARHGTDLRESLCIEAVEAKIQEKKPKMLMMFLDICRKSIEHLNPINLPFVTTPVQSANANKITIYAASIGEQSFEESQKTSRDPRGIFNQYLLEVLEKKNLNAFQVFQALQTKFRECQYNRQKFPQHPEMTINLEESSRSLWDPIDPDKHKILVQTRQRCCWEIMHSLPPNFAVKINDTDFFRLSFCKVASNVMDMIAVPHLTSISRVVLSLPKEKMDPVLQPIKISSLQSNPEATKFRFPNLQRLQSNLTLHLVIHIYATTSSKVTDTRVCKIDLGQPLISNCGLGEMKQSARIERKEPMEHSESSLLDKST